MAPSKKKKTITKAARFRLMPLTMTMLGLLLLVKANDVFIGSREIHRALTISSAQAAEEAKAEDEEAAKEAEHKADEEAIAKTDEPKEEAGGHGAPAKTDEPETALGKGKITLKEIEQLKEDSGKERYTDVELSILQNLSERRGELDQREKELELKETVLAATEDRINDKVKDMKELKVEVDKVLLLYNEKQEGEIKGLVKIYEAMKPIDAAVIFNELEMPILLEVIDKMSERKVAPILAGMDPKRARDVTQELAEMRKIREEKRQIASGLMAE
jgi:flagellar motility protein MotE (MotC chaperone)